MAPLLPFNYDYDTEDVRRDITCVPYEWGKDLDSKGKASVQLRSINKMVLWQITL